MDLPQSTPAKVCRECGQTFPATVDYFHQDGRTRDGLHNRCRTCRNRHEREVRQRDLAQRRAHDCAKRLAWRRRVLVHYSGDPPRCACCGEMHWEFLALDHVNGGGLKHRNSVGRSALAVFQWIVRQGFPPEFRVLCHNCNNARGFYGFCPHERERLAQQEVDT